ncbi:MAG: glycosyltransferase [Ruminococcaceae bacterium]|nr:glycosyltransferase [Oscillospiraceae bacterium]
MKKGHISVIMATYNCADTLSQSIDSILAQTYTDWKFIICDDCSTDNTYSILKQYEEQYPDKFLIIKNEKNSKLPFSLNHCLKYADGEYCARMDADDYVTADRFEKQVNFLKENPDYHLVGCALQTFSDDKGLGRIVYCTENPDKFSLLDSPCFPHAAIMTYTKVYNELGGYTVSPRTVRAQDYDLWFRFFAKGFKGTSLREPLYFMREDENSFLKRRARQYLWLMVTKWKGYRLLKFPLKCYWHILLTLAALFRNEFRKIKARISIGKKH